MTTETEYPESDALTHGPDQRLSIASKISCLSTALMTHSSWFSAHRTRRPHRIRGRNSPHPPRQKPTVFGVRF